MGLIIAATILAPSCGPPKFPQEGRIFGVAFFKDGWVAAKKFVVGGEFTDGEEHDQGLSTYHFTDGSRLTLSFVGEFKGGHYHGDYTVLSGAGIYANATGAGAFDSQPTKWKTGAFLFNVKLGVKTS